MQVHLVPLPSSSEISSCSSRLTYSLIFSCSCSPDILVDVRQTVLQSATSPLHFQKLDIKDFYGKLYSHYLPKGELQDNVFTSLNNGRTGGIIMGNYLSLYFAENALKKISDDFKMALEDASVNCHFEYFSDDFYIFCNRYDNEKIRKLFSQVLSFG